ncbi:MAG: prepilin-type N-terminal cleavage/methylation domain-containing protein [Gammaproteobacteria bacterium]|jgi:type IV pilus assembly protein PilW|nr:prepilin-type N-terminal cleavage/methylation domain-containing protein [Gammaproteobacteria bacterium]
MTMQLQRHQFRRGFTLIELMVSMLLGTFLIGGVIGVYIANSRTNQVNEQMGQVQQASQVSFQLLSRDVQHAGYAGCANIISTRVVNVLNPQPWWANWVGGVQGFENAAIPDFTAGAIPPLANTDGLHLMYGRGVSSSVVAHNAVAVPPLVINQNLGGIVANDILLGCDSRMAVIFKATAVAGNNISHGVGGAAPANSTLNFGVAPDGSLFQQNMSNDAGSVMPLESVGWFVGTQGGINSLFRVALVAGVAQIEEVVQNVQDLQLQYLVQGGNDYIDANLVVDWGTVMSIRATLTLADNPAMPMALGIRQISQVINLRNRRE